MGRLTGIDFIRSVAIALVLINHWEVTFLWDSAPAWVSPVFGWMGRTGVIIFLMTSGWLITTISKKVSPREFYIRRFSRILPLLFLTMAIAQSVFHLSPITPQSNLLLNPGDHNPLPYPLFANWILMADKQIGIYWGLLWTIACEIWFYLLFPLFQKLGEKRMKLCAIGTIAFAFLTNHNTPEWWSYNNFLAFGYIAVGVLAALEGYQPPQVNLPSVLLLPGKLCYGLYLWHPIALFLVWNKYEVTGYLGVSMAIALISFYLVEKPIERAIRKMAM